LDDSINVEQRFSNCGLWTTGGVAGGFGRKGIAKIVSALNK
jgi:hypothetical protein